MSNQTTTTTEGALTTLALEQIGRSPFNRKHFDQDALQLFAADLKARGILQPILVRKNPGYTFGFTKAGHDAPKICHVHSSDGTRVKGDLTEADALKLTGDLCDPVYELIAGERRWRAASMAGMRTIPAIIKMASDKEAIEDQAVENLQREDPNAIEEAEKYQQLVGIYKGEGSKAKEAVEMVASRLNISKSLVYERMRLLDLPEEVKTATLKGELPTSHAALIASVPDAKAQSALAKKILKGGYQDDGAVMSFRESKTLVAGEAVRVKFDQAWEIEREKLIKEGKQALTVAECRVVLEWYAFRANGENHVVIDQDCCDAKASGKTWEELLGKSAPPIIYGRSPREADKLVELYSKPAALVALGKLGKLKTEGDSDEESAEEKAEREAEELLKKSRADRDRKFDDLASKVSALPEGPGLWQFFFEIILEDCDLLDLAERVIVRRGVALPESAGQQEEVLKIMRNHFAKASGKDLRGFAMEVFFERLRPYSYAREEDWSGGLKAATKALGLKLPPWKTPVQASGKPAAKAKKDPAQ